MSSPSQGLTKLDYARQLAASLAYLMLRQKDAVGMYAFANGRGELIPPRSTPSHLRQLLVLLERLEAAGGTALAPPLHTLAGRVKQRGMVGILSGLPDDTGPIAGAVPQFRLLIDRSPDVFVPQSGIPLGASARRNSDPDPFPEQAPAAGDPLSDGHVPARPRAARDPPAPPARDPASHPAHPRHPPPRVRLCAA